MGTAVEGHRTSLHSDNMTVVAVIQKQLLHLLQCLYLYNSSTYSTHHLPGKENVVTDALSRDNMSSFHSLLPQGRQATVKDPMVKRFPNITQKLPFSPSESSIVMDQITCTCM